MKEHRDEALKLAGELHEFANAEWAQAQAQAAIVLALVDLADAIRGTPKEAG